MVDLIGRIKNTVPLKALERTYNLALDIESTATYLEDKIGIIIMNKEDHQELRQDRKITHSKHPDDKKIIDDTVAEKKILPEEGLDGGRIILNERIKSSLEYSAAIRVIINEEFCTDGHVYVCNLLSNDSDIFEYVILQPEKGQI